jgi:hypothetical protein
MKSIYSNRAMLEGYRTNRRKWAESGATVMALVAVCACSTPTVRLGEGPREYVAQDYDRVLQRWTRATELLSMSELDNVLSVTATYESWDFRWAYAVRYAEDYRLTVEQRRSLLEGSLEESKREHEFFVALYAQKHKWGDLTRDNPAWIVRLIDDTGNEVAPRDISEIRRPGAIEHTYFPYTSPWRRVFRISFAVAFGDGRATISPRARWFGLRFAGAQGNDQLVWQLGGAGDGDALSTRSTPRAASSSLVAENHSSVPPRPRL